MSVSLDCSIVQSKSIALDPNYTYSYVNLGALYFDTGQYQLAFQHYTKAIETGSKMAVPVFGRGLALQYMGEYKQAKQEYKKACNMGYRPACLELNKMNIIVPTASSLTERCQMNRCTKVINY